MSLGIRLSVCAHLVQSDINSCLNAYGAERGGPMLKDCIVSMGTLDFSSRSPSGISGVQILNDRTADIVCCLSLTVTESLYCHYESLGFSIPVLYIYENVTGIFQAAELHSK